MTSLGTLSVGQAAPGGGHGAGPLRAARDWAVHFLATEVQRCGKAWGLTEWLVQFRPLVADPRLLPAQLTHIHIHGAPAGHVRQVQVRAQADVVFSLNSLAEHGLQGSAAGEILQAMASMAGHPGMCITPVDLGRALPLHGTVVQLRLFAANLAGVMGVQVQAC